MADILLVAATQPEAGFLTSNKKGIAIGKIINVSTSAKHRVDLLITGPGMISTTYYLTKILNAHRYQLAVNIGICGSAIHDILPGKVVHISVDQFAGFGAENGSTFVDMFDLGLIKKNHFPFKKKQLHADFKLNMMCIKNLKKVEGITVQKVTGSNKSRNEIISNYGPVTESMEGAAFYYVCSMEKVKCIQVRAVSNKIEKRNREQWKMNEALSALNAFLGLFLMELETINIR